MLALQNEPAQQEVAISVCCMHDGNNADRDPRRREHQLSHTDMLCHVQCAWTLHPHHRTTRVVPVPHASAVNRQLPYVRYYVTTIHSKPTLETQQEEQKRFKSWVRTYESATFSHTQR